MKFNENVRAFRIDRGLTQKELADALGMNEYSVGDLERRRSSVNPDLLVALADIFECSVDYLLGRENDLSIIEIKESNVLSASDKMFLSSFQALSKEQKTLALDFISFIKKNLQKF